MYGKIEPKPIRVIEVIDEAIDIKTYYIELNRDICETVKPGQFFMIYAWGFGEIPVSVSDIVIENNKIVIGLTIRAIGSVTKYILENTKPGSIIGIRGPYGNGWFIENNLESNILIIAGGIGLAPLRPLIKYLIENTSKYRSLKILYGARSTNQILYRNDLNNWSNKQGVELYLTIDKPEPGWSGFTGFVTELIDKVDLSTDTVAYICGPEIMMKKSIEKLVNRGLKPENIYISLERRMRCGIGICGTCQLGHYFVCTDGPVFKYSELNKYIWIDGL